MNTFKKWLYFVFGFLGVWILVLNVISLFFFGGPRGIFFLFKQYLNNPKISGKPLTNPVNDIEGRFIYNRNEYGNSQYIICADDIDDAKKKIEEYFSELQMSSNRYFPEDISSAVWQEFEEYISADFQREIDNNKKWNVLRCDYFVHQVSQVPYSEAKNIKLGVYGGEKSKESLDHLVWYLMNIGVIQLTGFNQGATIDKSDITEISTEIVRKDSGIYTVHNDTPPFESYSSEVIYIYSLNKQDGSLNYTRQTENGK